MQTHLRMPFAERLHQIWQQVLDGRDAGGDRHFARIHADQLAAKGGIDAVETFDQGQGEVIQGLAFAGELHAAAGAIDQRHTELALQRADLQADRGLAQEQRLGRA